MEYNYVTMCLADVSILLPNHCVWCVSWQQLGSCSMTRPFLSLWRVWLARLTAFWSPNKLGRSLGTIPTISIVLGLGYYSARLHNMWDLVGVQRLVSLYRATCVTRPFLSLQRVWLARLTAFWSLNKLGRSLGTIPTTSIVLGLGYYSVWHCIICGI